MKWGGKDRITIFYWMYNIILKHFYCSFFFKEEMFQKGSPTPVKMFII